LNTSVKASPEQYIKNFKLYQAHRYYYSSMGAGFAVLRMAGMIGMTGFKLAE